LDASPHEFDYEYFYVSFDAYEVEDKERRNKIDVINEMERQANVLLQQQLPRDDRVLLMNPHKNASRLSSDRRNARAQHASAERMERLRELTNAAVQYVVDLLNDPALAEVRAQPLAAPELVVQGIPAKKEARNMSEQKFPEGWDEQRVKRLIKELDGRTDEEWTAPDEAAAEAGDDRAVITVPAALLPEIRRLLASHKTA
jgi:hypothetical protein